MLLGGTLPKLPWKQEDEAGGSGQGSSNWRSSSEVESESSDETSSESTESTSESDTSGPVEDTESFDGDLTSRLASPPLVYPSDDAEVAGV